MGTPFAAKGDFWNVFGHFFQMAMEGCLRNGWVAEDAVRTIMNNIAGKTLPSCMNGDGTVWTCKLSFRVELNLWISSRRRWGGTYSLRKGSWFSMMVQTADIVLLAMNKRTAQTLVKELNEGVAKCGSE